MSESSLAIITLLENASRGQVWVSESAKNILKEDLLQKTAVCLGKTHDLITLTSAFPGSEQNAVNVELARGSMNHFIFDSIKNMKDIDESRLLQRLNTAIKSQKAGNCYEYSFYTKSLLAKEGINAEVFRVRSNLEDNHIFLIINRDPGSAAENFYQWNHDALLVDPYLKKIYLASEIPHELQSCSHDSQYNTVSYIPFDPMRHKLDNQVQKETLEDWQAVLETHKAHLPFHASQQDIIENVDTSSSNTHLKK